MLDLSPESQRILDYLVRSLPQVKPAKPETYFTYKTVHQDLGLPGIPHELEHLGLGGLATALYAEGLPGITGLIIRRDTFTPGPGYFNLFERPRDDFAWWNAEIRKVVDFDWSPYSNAATSKNYPRTPRASDAGKVERVETKIYRVLRDTALALKIKHMHNYTCQICGETITLADGGRYAEAHHIHPLGTPHDGPDCAENIICVCPNHHVMLDYFAIPLDLVDIRTADGHDIGVRFLDFHNQKYAEIKAGGD